MRGVEMLDQDKTHSGIHREVLQQESESFETSSGGPNSYNGKWDIVRFHSLSFAAWALAVVRASR